MKKALDIPLVTQQKKSFDCSIASLKMIMDYWKDDVSYNVLASELSKWISEKEIHIQGVAIYLARREYEVWFTHHDPNVIDNQTEDLSESDKTKLEKVLESEDILTSFRKKKLTLDIEYIEASGHYSTAIPTLALLNSNLRQDMPILICVNNKIWRSDPTLTGNHYVVVIGKEDDMYIINDPNPKVQSPYKVNRNKLVMSWYTTGAYTLVAKLKKKRPGQV